MTRRGRETLTIKNIFLLLWATLGLVIAIAASRASQRNEPPPLWSEIATIPFFTYGFLFAVASQAKNSGWAGLAERYRAIRRPDGPSYGRQVLRFGGIPEGGVTRMVIAIEGLYLHVMPLFRIGHPPLLIPWDRIRCTRGPRHLIWGATYELDLDGVTSLRIRRKAFEELRRFVPEPTDRAV